MSGHETHHGVMVAFEHVDVFELYYAMDSPNLPHDAPLFENDTRIGWQFRGDFRSESDALLFAKQEGRSFRWLEKKSPKLIRPGATAFWIRKVNAVRGDQGGRGYRKLSPPVEFLTPKKNIAVAD